MSRKPPLSTVGEAPDPRFTYANERTFLAWNRTALALIAGGLAVIAVLPAFDLDYGRRVIGVPLILLGAVLAVASYRQWDRNERAMRLRQPLPPSRLGLLLSVGVACTGVIAAVVAAFGGSS